MTAATTLKAATLCVCLLFVSACSFTTYQSASSRNSGSAYGITAQHIGRPNTPARFQEPRFKPSVQSVQNKARSRSGGVHRVTAGETLYSISRRYGVPVRDIIVANSFRAPYHLSVGQAVRLPAPGVHVVQKGETGYSISRRYGVTVSSLMSFNGIRPPYTLSIGQKLRLPGGAQASTSYAQAATPSTPRQSSRGTTSSQSSSKPVVRKSLPAPPPREGSRFQWPVRGKVISRFGPREGGKHNDGINILADTGTPVLASDSGVVAYASNALEGYGNLLLIKHSGGWVTAYAHNERLLVREGETVKRGQVIARVGRSGGVEAPQLHFEVRKGRQALDPTLYLSAQ